MEKDEKKVWKPAEINEMGHVADVIRGGDGKLSPVGSDPGESKKVQPDE